MTVHPDNHEAQNPLNTARNQPNPEHLAPIWLKNTASALSHRSVAPEKNRAFQSILSEYLEKYPGPPHRIPVHSMTDFINSKAECLRPQTARALLFFYEHVKASNSHVCALWQYLSLSDSATNWLDSLTLKLMADKYSAQTRSTYLNAVTLFLAAVKKDPKQITCREVKEYLAGLREKGHLDPTIVDNYRQALQFFYKKILGQEDFLLKTP